MVKFLQKNRVTAFFACFLGSIKALFYSSIPISSGMQRVMGTRGQVDKIMFDMQKKVAESIKVTTPLPPSACYC